MCQPFRYRRHRGILIETHDILNLGAFASLLKLAHAAPFKQSHDAEGLVKGHLDHLPRLEAVGRPFVHDLV